jgi:DNA-binding MarR family transcriptional regulator
MTTPDLNDIIVTPESLEAVVAASWKFDLNASPSHLLHRAQQVASELHAASFGIAGFTQRQLAVLVVLGEGDGISQTELVLKTGIDRSTIAEMVARMETKSLVARAKSPSDSRAKVVSLTQTGRDALLLALPKLKDIDKQVLSFLTAGRRDTLVELLTKIVEPDVGKASKKLTADRKKSKKKDKKRKSKKKKVEKG